VARWTDDNEHDPGITLVELFGYLADALSYYEDAVAAEARVATRRRWALALAVAVIACVRCRRPREA
jgi:hypothetical protein